MGIQDAWISDQTNKQKLIYLKWKHFNEIMWMLYVAEQRWGMSRWQTNELQLGIPAQSSFWVYLTALQAGTLDQTKQTILNKSPTV